MEQYIFEETKVNDLSHKLFRVKDEIKKVKGTKKLAIVIAGQSLLLIDTDSLVKNLFLEVSEQVDVVLACRVSPK
jgi:hypothetical protein